VPVHEHSPAQLAATIHRGGIRLVEEHSHEWITLCQHSLTDAPFYRPEWITAYLRAFEPQARVVLAMARSAGGLRALLPLVERETNFCGIPVRTLRGAGNEHSGRFDLVRATGEEGDLGVRALWNALRDQPDWDVIELPYVPEESAAEDLLRAADGDGFLTGHYESYTSPYVVLPDNGQVDELPISARFRRNLRGRKRKAQENWPVFLRRIDAADPIEVDRFFELEASGWKRKEKTAIVCSEATRSFYEEIAYAASKCGYFSLYLLGFGDTVVAGHFGLSYQGRYYSPKVAYNEAFAEYGPGHLIIDAILRDLQSRKFCEFDFLGPWMDWKGEWTRGGRKHSFCYIFRPTVFGEALYAAKLKVRDKLRRVAPLRRAVHALSHIRNTPGS
jgi:CelD/BcsL family acetyltransferase involved in cellulose biosynthesis